MAARPSAAQARRPNPKAVVQPATWQPPGTVGRKPPPPVAPAVRHDPRQLWLLPPPAPEVRP
jgi:hypothetical protein